ncbi:uncharacterized protein [Miscanthus floridulus]|uniref:uncharacterized protein isoform X2 n=1 Tax=Miscanthus floridulus TaxID=154761 RepID=UPI0034595385
MPTLPNPFPLLPLSLSPWCSMMWMTAAHTVSGYLTAHSSLCVRAECCKVFRCAHWFLQKKEFAISKKSEQEEFKATGRANPGMLLFFDGGCLGLLLGKAAPEAMVVHRLEGDLLVGPTDPAAHPLFAPFEFRWDFGVPEGHPVIISISMCQSVVVSDCIMVML